LLTLTLTSACFVGGDPASNSSAGGTAGETDGETDGEVGTDATPPDLPNSGPTPDLPTDPDPDPDSDLPLDSAPICGDGNVDPGEDCDDGNELDADGCNVDCRSSGAELFAIRIDPEPLAPGARTRAAAFGVSSAHDDVVVVGYQEFALADPADKQRDGWMARYDGEGALLWQTRVGQSTSAEAFEAVESSGPHLYVSGTLAGRGQLLRVDSADGSLEQILVDLPDQRIHDHAMILGADAAVVGEQAGHAEARLYDQLFGPPVWEHDLFGFGFTAYYGVALAEDLEFAYVCGELASDNLGQMGWLLRYDLIAGETQWDVNFGELGASANAVAVLGDDDVIVVGWLPVANQGRDAYVARYQQSGVLVWVQQLEGGLASSDGALGVAVDSQDMIVVAGSRSSIAGNGEDPWVLKLDGDGGLLWQQQLSVGVGNGTFIDVAVMYDDRIALAGVDGLSAIVHMLAP
jgi:cysteine-rich repeat protein